MCSAANCKRLSSLGILVDLFLKFMTFKAIDCHAHLPNTLSLLHTLAHISTLLFALGHLYKESSCNNNCQVHKQEKSPGSTKLGLTILHKI